MRRIRKDMSEEQVSDGDVSEDDRSDAFRQAGVAAIGIERSASGSCFACLRVAAAALCGSRFV